MAKAGMLRALASAATARNRGCSSTPSRREVSRVKECVRCCTGRRSGRESRPLTAPGRLLHSTHLSPINPHMNRNILSLTIAASLLAACGAGGPTPEQQAMMDKEAANKAAFENIGKAWNTGDDKAL